MHKTSARRFAALSLACAGAFAATAAPALAASATITGDDLAGVPLTPGLALRNMAPDITFAFATEENAYSAKVIGPAGPASDGTGTCASTDAASTERVRYQGNGTYTLVMKVGGSVEACQAAAEEAVPFTINATAAIMPLKPALLNRDIGETSLIDWDLPVAVTPGANSYELKYALNATIGPDGAIAGPAETGDVSIGTSEASVRFPKPGKYTFVVRAKSVRSDVFTPWSPRADVQIYAPFDLASLRLTDKRGPSYALAAKVRERTARGKVTISIGKGSNPRRFKRLGVVKIGKNGRFKLRYRVSKFGQYTVKFSYKGNATTDSGFVSYPFTTFLGP
jgi:hypothetical protein